MFPLKGGLLFDASQITHAHKENKEKEFKSEYRGNMYLMVPIFAKKLGPLNILRKTEQIRLIPKVSLSCEC